MRRVPLIKSVMTAFPYSISDTETLGKAEEMMLAHGIGHLPVKSGEELIGVMTASRLQLAIGQAPSEDEGRHKTIRDIGVREAYVVDMQERLDSVLLYMAKARIDATLIMRKGRLAGIFTKTDACRYFGNWLRERFPTGGGDGAA